MKSLIPPVQLQSGQGLVLSGLRSALLPGMSCPIRHNSPDHSPELHEQLRQAWHDKSLWIALPGYEHQRNSSTSVGCLAQMTAHQVLEDGTSLSILKGLGRVQFSEVRSDDVRNDNDQLPIANYRVFSDIYPKRPVINRKHRREEMLALFFKRFQGLADNDTVASLLYDEMPLGALCDLLASSALLDQLDGIQLLGEMNVDFRSEFVLEKLKETLKLARSGSFSFPPQFSGN